MIAATCDPLWSVNARLGALLRLMFPNALDPGMDTDVLGVGYLDDWTDRMAEEARDAEDAARMLDELKRRTNAH